MKTDYFFVFIVDERQDVGHTDAPIKIDSTFRGLPVEPFEVFIGKDTPAGNGGSDILFEFIQRSIGFFRYQFFEKIKEWTETK